MSFFGFEQGDLESEKRRALENGLDSAQNEDLAVYTWGEKSYDGLGDALEERGDELNDETFGGTGAVGKDFDFANTALLGDTHPPAESLKDFQRAQILEQDISHAASQASSGTSIRPSRTVESIWDNKSPFSVLPKMNGVARPGERPTSQASNRLPTSTSAPLHAPTAQTRLTGVGGADLHKGVHTLEEIEAEMRAAAARQYAQTPNAIAQSPARGPIARVGTPQHAPTPPPRMHPHAQSPRFHQQQQQEQIHALQLQQLQRQQQLERQQQQLEMQARQEREQQLLEMRMREQLLLEEAERQRRVEDMERQRQLRIQQMQTGVSDNVPGHMMHQRHSSNGLSPSPSLANQLRRLGRQSPAVQMEVPFQQNMAYLPQDIQMQQRLLAEMAQAEFIHNMQGGTPQPERNSREEQEIQEVLRVEAMRKIMEAERMEEKRRRKLTKIAHMSRYNDLMTQSDKDFITRIQVSQLVTLDPYADDFYAQVYGAIIRTRQGINAQDERVLKFGSGGGVGLGLGQRGAGRRQGAMQRMEQQVERIVNNARLREKEKITLNSLQGALGKTSGRSYKAAPRQLLQVDSTSPTTSPMHAHISKADAAEESRSGAAKEAAKIGREALGSAADSHNLERKDPLTHREALIVLERLYDNVLDLEQKRRDQPPPEDESFEDWNQELEELVQQLWDGLKVMVPLETSVPHPFISLITPIKGKRLLPRVVRHLSTQQMFTMLTLLVACFSQVDVVNDAGILDTLEETSERIEVENQTQAFLSGVIPSMLTVVGKAQPRLVSGLLGLLIERCDVAAIARTRPGVALLTLFLSRIEVIKQSVPTAIDSSDEEMIQWKLMYDHLFELLAPHLLLLFPSVRQNAVSGVGYSNIPNVDIIDQPVWQFLAALALHANMEQAHILITSLREIVLESVTSVKKGWVPDPEVSRARLGNVDLFLRALGLDSSQIAM